MRSRGRSRLSHARSVRATAALFAGACFAVGAASASSTPLISIPSPAGSASSPPLISVATPETAPGAPLIGISVGGKPTVGVSTPDTSPGGQLVGVSVGGKPTVSVSTPTLPAVEAPAVGNPLPPTPTAPSTPSPSAPAEGSRTSSGAAPASAKAASIGAVGDSPGASGAAVPTGSRRGGSDPTAAGAHRVHTAKHVSSARSAASTASSLSGALAPLAASVSDGAGNGGSAVATTQSSSNPLEAIGREIPLPLPVPDWSKPIILALLLLAIGLGTRAFLASRRARRLEAQGVTLRRDIAAMQAALVPEVPARVGGAAVSVAYRPAEGPAAGGDFYDVFEPSPGRVAVIVGDVVGHGHDALTQAALARYTLRAYVQAGLEPRAALALAGCTLADPSCERLTTVALAVYDSETATLTYALAGHPPPIIRGREMRDPLMVCCSPPIGWIEPTGRRQSTLSFAAGTEVCFFTDGLTEARCAGWGRTGCSAVSD